MRFNLVALAGLALVVASSCRNLTIEEPKVGSLRGLVVDKQGPISALEVHLAADDATQVLTTDAAGAFSASGLRPGAWSVTIERAGSLPFSRAVFISAGQERDLGTLTLFSEAPDVETAGTISGKVQAAGVDSAALAGGTVEALLQPDMRLLGTQAIGASGLFALQVPPGTYLVRVTHPLFVTATKRDVPVVSKASVALQDGDLVLQLNPGRVTGRVLREVDQAAPVPAAGVVVSADNGSSTTTATDGTFDLGGLPGGDRRLTFVLAGLHSTTPSTTITVTPGQSNVLADVQLLLDRGGVTGAVEMGDGSALRDVVVFVDGTTSSVNVVPNPSAPSRGSFRVPNLPVGTYSLTATRSGYRNVSSGSFTVTASTDVALGTLARMTRVLGEFLIEDQDPTNSPGFTRTQRVQLVVNNPASVASYRVAESDPASALLPYLPFGADGGTAIAFDLSAGDGEKTVFLQLKDSQGAEGSVLTASVVVDSLPPPSPSLVLAGGTGFTRQANPLPFSLSGVDAVPTQGAASGVAFMRLSSTNTVDGAGNLSGVRVPYQRDASFDRGSSAEGPVSVFAQLIDNAGNAGAVASAQVVVDTLPPTGTLSIDRGVLATQNGFTNSVQVTLSVSAAAEPNSGVVKVRLANTALDVVTATPTSFTSSLGWFLDPAADGLRTVTYRFIDSAGNESAPQSASITLDRAAPTPLLPSTVLATAASALVTNSRNGSFTATARDDFAMSPTQAVLLNVNGTNSALPPTTSTTVTGAVPFTLVDLDGAQPVSIAFKDAAGNVSAATELTVTLDRVAPSGSFSVRGVLADGAASSTLTATQTVGVDVLQFGASRVLVTTGALASCPALPGTYLSLGDPALAAFNLGVANGVVTVRACLADAAGNTALLAPVTVRVDSTTPTGCALTLAGTLRDGTAAPAGVTANPSVTASLSTCSEAPVELFLVEGPVTCNASVGATWSTVATFTSTLLGGPDASHTVQGCVRDAAHNVGALAAATMTVDTTPPTGPSLQVNGGSLFINQAAVSGGLHTASVVGQASGATEWAVGVSATPTNFASLPANSSRSVSVPVSADGPLTFFARFRDAVGNETYTTAVVTADLTLPTPPGLTVRPTGDVGFVNSEVVTVALTGLAGAAGVRLAEGADLATCTTALGSAVQQPPSSTLTTLLAPSDGPHVVCGRAVDLAGNASTVASAAVQLDRVPPTRPVIVTPDGYQQLANAALMAVSISSPSTDTNFRGYERLGPDVSNWTAATPVGTTFQLPVFNDGSEDGFRNELRLRAVDRAGNASADSVVIITADTNPPDALTVANAGGTAGDWVDNGDRQARIVWVDPVTPGSHIVAYEVDYGSTSGNYNGAYAAEGPSPVTTTTSGSLVLSGLTNGAATYARVTPIDAAGNAGPQTPELMLQPNEVSPNRISTLSISNQNFLYSMVAYDSYLYVAGCVAASSQALLTVVDLQQLAPQLVNGRPGSASLARPQQGAQLSFADGINCVATPNDRVLLSVNGSWLFMASGHHVRMLDLSNPASPSVLLDLDFTVVAPNFLPHSVSLKGDRLVIDGANAGAGEVRVVSLAPLFDSNAATSLTPASADAGVLATLVPFASHAVFLRDRMLAFSSGSTTSTNVALGDVYDNSSVTVLDTADRTSGVGGLKAGNYAPVVNGGIGILNASLQTGFSEHGLTNVFTGSLAPAPIFQTGFIANGQMDLLGSEAFLSHPSLGLRVLDLSDAWSNRIRASATYSPSVAPNQTLVVGHVVVVGNVLNALSFVELATPRGLTVDSITQGAGGALWVQQGFLHSAGFVTWDLQQGGYPVLTGSAAVCSTGNVAVFGDTEVFAIGNGVRVHDFELDLDGSVFTQSASATYTATWTTGRVTGVAAWGQFLVASVVRSDGVYLDVLDARKLSNKYFGTNFSFAADLRASLRVSAFVTTLQTMADVSVSRGRAVLTIDQAPGTFPAAAGANLFLVDLRGAIDDDASTAFSAASVVASLNAPASRQAVLRGRYVYAATNDGMRIYDVTNAVATPPTALPSNNPIAVGGSGLPFSGLAVSGSLVLATPAPNSSTTQTVSIDVSNPAAPALIAAVPTFNGQFACTPSGDTTARILQTFVTVAGSRAYVKQSDDSVMVLHLE